MKANERWEFQKYMTQFIQKKTHFSKVYKLYSLLLLCDIKYWYWFSLPWIYVCCKLSMISHRANTLHCLSVSLFLCLVFHCFCKWWAHQWSTFIRNIPWYNSVNFPTFQNRFNFTRNTSKFLLDPAEKQDTDQLEYPYNRICFRIS